MDSWFEVFDFAQAAARYISDHQLSKLSCEKVVGLQELSLRLGLGCLLSPDL